MNTFSEINDCYSLNEYLFLFLINDISIYKYFIIKFIIVLPFPPNYGLPELQPNHIEWINHVKNKNNKFLNKKIKTIEH